MIEPTEPYVIIPHAKVGMPGAELCEVFDLACVPPRSLRFVIECDAIAGWLVRHAQDAQGKFIVEGDKVKTERVEGRFEIRKYLAP